MSEIPRRIRIDLFTPAEKAIYDAVQAVEAAGCDVRLTNAVVLLSDARAWVADFVDGVPPEDHYPRPAPANPGDDAGDLVHAVRAVWLSARTNDDTPRGCYLVDSEPMLRAHAAMRAALAAPANRETAEVHSGSPGGEGDVVGDGHGARGVKAAAPSTGTPTAGGPSLAANRETGTPLAPCAHGRPEASCDRCNRCACGSWFLRSVLPGAARCEEHVDHDGIRHTRGGCAPSPPGTWVDDGQGFGSRAPSSPAEDAPTPNSSSDGKREG